MMQDSNTFSIEVIVEKVAFLPLVQILVGYTCHLMEVADLALCKM